MKTTTMILMVAGGLALPAVAADPASGPSAQTKIKVKTVLPIFQLAHPKSVPNYNIDRLGNSSSRPWDQVAGQPGGPVFADQRAYLNQPNFNLFWIGNSPQ
jgi:hypothetical protein